MISTECASGHHGTDCPGEQQTGTCTCVCHPWNHRATCTYPTAHRACTCYQPDTEWS